VILYQGEELGLLQPTLPRHAVTDPLDLLYWPDGPGREGPRVPIPWSEDETRGFSTGGEPWLPMDWPQGVSVAVQEISAQSNLGFYRRAMRFRTESELNNMDLCDWSRDGEVIRLRYARRSGDAACDVVLNFGREAVEVEAGADFASTSFEGRSMPGRCAAAWVRT
jgi:alpha-glucosidase